jgi:hypothetical protein
VASQFEGLRKVIEDAGAKPEKVPKAAQMALQVCGHAISEMKHAHRG